MKLMSKAIIHGIQGVALKKFDVSCQISMLDPIISPTSHVGYFFEAEKLSTEWESSLGCLIGPPKCGAWCLYMYEPKAPRPESQAAANQLHCKVEGIAFREWTKKTMHRQRIRTNTLDQSCHCSEILKLLSCSQRVSVPEVHKSGPQ